MGYHYWYLGGWAGFRFRGPGRVSTERCPPTLAMRLGSGTMISSSVQSVPYWNDAILRPLMVNVCALAYWYYIIGSMYDYRMGRFILFVSISCLLGCIGSED